MHLDLNDLQPGAYVILSDVPPWDVVRQAYQFFGKDADDRLKMLMTGEEGEKFVKAIFETMLDEWNLKDRKGNLIPPSDVFPVEMISRNLDGRIVAKIFSEAQNIILSSGDSDPNV